MPGLDEKNSLENGFLAENGLILRKIFLSKSWLYENILLPASINVNSASETAKHLIPWPNCILTSYNCIVSVKHMLHLSAYHKEIYLD